MKNRGEVLRVRLESLGGVWVKLGQMMSTRHDLFPRETCDALKGLQYKMSGVPGPYGRDIVVAELGSMDAFESFEDDPCAAATTGQVHRGVLASSHRKVAVKIIGEETREKYKTDLALLARVSWCLGWLSPRMKLRDLVEELTSILTEELDLRFEAAHMPLLRVMMKSQGLHVPRVHRKLCTASLLVTDYVDGTVMTDVLAMDRPEMFLRSKGMSGKRVSKKLLRCFERQVLEYNLYPGDMHPGNIIVSHRLNVVDHGTTSASDKSFLARLTAFITSMSAGDYSRAADMYCLLCIWSKTSMIPRWISVWWSGEEEQRHAEVRRQIARSLSAWATRARVNTLPFSARSFNRLSMDLAPIVLNNRGSMRWEWMRLTRAWSTIEGTIEVLWPRLNYVKELRLYFRKAAQRESIKPIRVEHIMNSAREIMEQVREGLALSTAWLRLEGVLQGS